MTESQYSGKIVAYLRDSGNLTFKHCDRFTRSVPDVSTTSGFGTTWLEMKYLKRGEEFYDRAMEKKDQFFNMLALSALSSAFYIMGREDLTWVFRPRIFLIKRTNAELEKMAAEKFTNLPSLDFRPRSFPINDYASILQLTRYSR